VGAVLAGGSGTRLGAPSKPAALLAGRPLISYPAEALRRVCETVVVVCKADTELPSLPAVDARWDEPDEPRHPLTGIVHALQRAERPVLVCAADMPFVDATTLRALTEPEGSAVVATSAGHLVPVLALYRQAALERLQAAEPNSALRETVNGLHPATVEVPPATAFSVNTLEDLQAAQARLSA
jgi:molybdopterin-guanine dinucleotide biosynthesis protein A